MFRDFIKKYSWPIILFVAVVITGSMAIFASDTTLNANVETDAFVRSMVSYLLLLYILAYMMPRTVKNDQMQFIGIALLWWLIGVIHTAPEVKIQWNVMSLVVLIAYSYFNPEERIKAYELYRYYIIIMCGGGLVAYIAFMLNIPLPHEVVPFYTGQEIQRHIYVWGFYYNYYIGFLWGADGMGRLCGWFNEPGYLGTIASLILIAENVNLKRIGNIVILLACICTFSLAALFIVVGYMLILALRRGKMIVGLVCLVTSLVIVVPIVFEGNEVYENFAERLAFEDGEFKGDNRANHKIFKRLRERQFSEFIPAMFGYGTGALEKQGNLGILGIEVQMYLYGIVGILLTYGMLLIYAWKQARGSYEAKAFIIMFFLSTYQRPYIFAGDYIVILFGGIAAIQQLRREKMLKAAEDKDENDCEELEDVQKADVIADVPINLRKV